MSKEINKQLGQRIKTLRKQKGYSQEKFAEALNIATTSLSYIETGRGFMTLATLEKMANVLELEPYEIFQFVTVKTKNEMYNYISDKLDLIKNDEERLKVVYTILKSLF